MTQKFDTVDVHVTSQTYRVDAILQDPLLDGQKRYTVEVTEFTCPLSSESPLPATALFENTDNYQLIRVRRKNILSPGVINDATSLSTLNVIGPLFAPAVGPRKDIFVPSAFSPMRTPSDVTYYLQRFFDDIKNIYIANANGIVVAEHGGGGPPANQPLTAADVFAKVLMLPNGTLRFYFGALFCKHFFLELSAFGSKLLGLESLVAYRLVGGVLLTGAVALTGNADGLGPPIAGLTNETMVQQAQYPLTRHFDHRVRCDIETDMPVPQTIVWSTDNLQKISHVIASFPINMRTSTSLLLNSEGASEGEVSHTADLFSGDIVWRRAEDRVAERYEITSSKFFQNVRLGVFMTRREWSVAKSAYSFVRRPIQLSDGESWTAKLRFRTL